MRTYDKLIATIFSSRKWGRLPLLTGFDSARGSYGNPSPILPLQAST